MTILYFVIAAVAAAGAGLLLWFDRRRVPAVSHATARSAWADEHGCEFRAADPAIAGRFRRAAMNIDATTTITGVVDGRYEGARILVFDVGDDVTVAALQGPVSSAVVIDLRDEDAFAPAESDVIPLGAMGRRVLFATDLDIARRVCDRRMVALATNAPNFIDILWNEGDWVLGAMARTDDAHRLDAALDTVRRLSDLLRVLPPSVPHRPGSDIRDPHAPSGGRTPLAAASSRPIRPVPAAGRGEIPVFRPGANSPRPPTFDRSTTQPPAED